MKVFGQAALVTGGGSGLGATTSQELAQRGAKLALLDIDAEKARAIVVAIEAAGGQAVAIGCDVPSADGRVGREAYSASTGGVAAMTLPLARDLAQGRRTRGHPCPLAVPYPAASELPLPVQDSLALSIPIPPHEGDKP